MPIQVDFLGLICFVTQGPGQGYDAAIVDASQPANPCNPKVPLEPHRAVLHIEDRFVTDGGKNWAGSTLAGSEWEFPIHDHVAIDLHNVSTPDPGKPLQIDSRWVGCLPLLGKEFGMKLGNYTPKTAGHALIMRGTLAPICNGRAIATRLVADSTGEVVIRASSDYVELTSNPEARIVNTSNVHSTPSHWFHYYKLAEPPLPECRNNTKNVCCRDNTSVIWPEDTEIDCSNSHWP